MKFVFEHEKKKEKDSHWEQCEKNNAPFIILKKVNNRYTNIFYDVTNLDIDLETLSDDIKRLYSAYTDFFMCETSLTEKLYDQYYFFNIIVKNEHASFLAENLYDYLLVKINN